jgi:hypothetical protein
VWTNGSRTNSVNPPVWSCTAAIERRCWTQWCGGVHVVVHRRRAGRQSHLVRGTDHLDPACRRQLPFGEGPAQVVVEDLGRGARDAICSADPTGTPSAGAGLDHPPTVYIREDRLVAKINGWMPDSSVLNTSRTPSPRLSTLRTVLAPAETAQAALRCRIMWPRSPVPDSDHACG